MGKNDKFRLPEMDSGQSMDYPRNNGREMKYNRQFAEVESGQSPDCSRSTIDAMKCNSRSSECSKSTIDPLREVCLESDDTSFYDEKRHEYVNYRQSKYDPGVDCFSSVITPITNLSSPYSQSCGCIELRMRRKNKTVTFQWEPFSGAIAQSGVAYLTVCQSVCNTPPYPLFFPILLSYKGINQGGVLNIDPCGPTNIKFYLNPDLSTTGITIGDTFMFYGGSVTWIVD
jgi:hypothetical protein